MGVGVKDKSIFSPQLKAGANFAKQRKKWRDLGNSVRVGVLDKSLFLNQLKASANFGNKNAIDEKFLENLWA